jgi:hypothetical protein
MNAANPATRSSHTPLHFRECFLDADISRLFFLARYHPTNPFVASEWGNVLPEREYFWRCGDSLSQVVRKFVDSTRSDGGDHTLFFLLTPLPTRRFAFFVDDSNVGDR